MRGTAARLIRNEVINISGLTTDVFYKRVSPVKVGKEKHQIMWQTHPYRNMYRKLKRVWNSVPRTSRSEKTLSKIMNTIKSRLAQG